MFIRIGYEKIVIESKGGHGSSSLALSPHSSFGGRDHRLGRGAGGSAPAAGAFLPISFGNRLNALRAPAGRNEALVRLHRRGSTVRPDPYELEPPCSTDVGEPPAPRRCSFLTASRYCDSDPAGRPKALKAVSASTEPGLGPGAGESAINVQNHLTLTATASPTVQDRSERMRRRTASDGTSPIWRIAFCRAMSIPARYAKAATGRHRRPPQDPGDFCAGSSVSRRPLGTPSMRGTIRPGSAGADGPWPGRGRRRDDHVGSRLRHEGVPGLEERGSTTSPTAQRPHEHLDATPPKMPGEPLTLATDWLSS